MSASIGGHNYAAKEPLTPQWALQYPTEDEVARRLGWNPSIRGFNKAGISSQPTGLQNHW